MTKKIELIYGANPENLYIWKRDYPEDQVVTVQQVIDDSQVLQIYKLELSAVTPCIYTEPTTLDHQVQDGDRVSLLRPLLRRRQTAPRERAA